MGDYTPTAEQQAIIDAFQDGGNVTISAGAGAGKTSTLVQAAATRPNVRIAYTAFNRKIVMDAKAKFGTNVAAGTLHSFAYGAVVPTDGGWRRGRLEDNRRQRGAEVARILGITSPHRINAEKVLAPAVLAGLATGMVDRFCDSADTRIGWWHMPFRPGMDDKDTRKALGQVLLPFAEKAWADLTRPDGKVKYGHSHYLKEFQLGGGRMGADVILLDEAQDSNGVTIAILKNQGDAQIVTVGDENQAIYGWRGAVDAMGSFNGHRLTLTQSFRFGPAVADQANMWLELIGSDLRIKGLPSIDSRVTELERPDAILCRTNAEAISRVMGFQQAGVKVALLGGGSEMKRLAESAQKLQQEGWCPHPELAAFASWGQVQDYVENEDSGSDLKVFVRLIDNHGADAVIAAMDGLSSERYAQVTVSTAHKCKGAEWGRVKIADDFKAPKPDADGRLIPEREGGMLNYVAVTRAQLALDRGSLSWVDEAIADLRGTAPVKAAPAPVERVEVTSGGIPLAPHESPFYVAPAAAPAPSDDGGLEEFVAAVRSVLRDPHTAACEWVAGHIRDGQLAGVGRGMSKWAAVTGPVGAPTVSWHRYRAEALALTGLAITESVPA